MADFPQQGSSTSKRPYSEYLADTIATQPSNSGIQQQEANPLNSYPQYREFDGSIPALDSRTWLGQPQLLPYDFNNTPLQTSYISGNIHNNYGGYGYDIQQPFIPPTVFTTPACIFPSDSMPGTLHQYPVNQREGVWTNHQNYQGLMEPSLNCETTSNSQWPPEPELVCFGMIKGLSARCRPSVNYSLSDSVKLLDAENFVGSDDASIEGKVSYEFTYLTSALFTQSELVLEINCSTLDSPSKPGPQIPGKRIPGYSAQCTLDIIIYGPSGLSQDVGSFFEEYDLYLQDPVNCKRNVRYHNPHRLSVDPSDVKYTFDLGNPTAPLANTIDINDHSELLDIIFSHQDLAEAAQPRSIRTPLKPHQKQALTFLLQRECGWAWDGCRPDIWEVRDNGHESYFYNTVSGAVQVEQPPQFYGGIVADPMGLGKTLSMIALVACDVRAEDIEPSSLPGVDIEVSSGKTLIIVPAPLMGSWEEQLQRHCFPNSLPWRCHHNQSRLRVASDLDQVAIVLTTYHTVMTEWKKGKETDQSIIFTTKWKRVILDEAHYIRNINSQLSRAICSLDSVSRWAVTGTPIQNRLSDLTALFKFLRVYPYSEKRHFDADISSLWKSGNDEKAVQRLKRITSCLLLRRPKTVIQLPPIHNLQLQVEFSTAERKLYEDVRLQVLSQLNDSVPASFKSLQPNFFINILQKIEAMRMICNLGLHYHLRHEKPSFQESADDWQSEAQKAFNLRREEGVIQCQLCGLRLDEMESLVDEGVQGGKPWFSRCLAFLCPVCSQSESNRQNFCPHKPTCRIAAVTIDTPFSELSVGIPSVSHEIPSKVAMLLCDLRKQSPQTKCVVFSSWRTTLNVIQAGLDHESIPFLRFDGTIMQKERHNVIERFRNDPRIRVLLLTLTCGAVGLTLTEASRAYLMEPSWNPTLEDQALARIHRIGQTQEVTTLRMFVQNSFEERIIEAQASKRDLARILLTPSNGDENENESGLNRLEFLRRLV
ncbi:alpha-1 6-mannosyltransferase subunit [Fusarium mundagurra]|uniref:Alpha-1 6-mannosyltransferase subunit n=1 Tax=Fusarium mundagurra TaxID=1567541 RepID=A0A8H5YP06_9HYPO|nr:alpha-1 6-mannosyltransferase subunit [Fusarium mundagurra]